MESRGSRFITDVVGFSLPMLWAPTWSPRLRSVTKARGIDCKRSFRHGWRMLSGVGSRLQRFKESGLFASISSITTSNWNMPIAYSPGLRAKLRVGGTGL